MLLAFFFLGALTANSALGATYFVSLEGNDDNPGTEAAPFRTIGRAAALMGPGDTCVVHEGFYRETVRPTKSGTEHAPIRFVAAENEKVWVAGTEQITGWTLHQGKIYRAQVDFDFDQLFVDGRMMIEARWPNTGLDLLHPTLAEADGGKDNLTLVDADLTQPDGFWVGATAHIIPGAHWVSWTRTITGYSQERHELSWDEPWSTDWAYITKEGSRYYLFGKLELLDAPGEWYLDKATGTVYLWLPEGDDPLLHVVEAKRRSLAFDLSGLSHVELRGFCVFGATITMAGADHCLVEDCHVLYPSHFTQCAGWGTGMDDTGIVISGHDNELRRSSVAYSAGNGVTLLGESNKMVNCLVHDCNYMATECGVVRAMGRHHLISHCTLFNGGRSVLVNRYLRASRVEYNHMFNAGLLTADLGVTYCYDTDGEGTVIAYNWVHDNHAVTGVGIYIDNNSPNHVIHHNCSWNNRDSGIRLNTPTANILVYNNTCYNNGDSINYWGPDNNSEWQGSRIFNNIFTDTVRLGTNIEAGSNYEGKEPGFVDAESGDFGLAEGSPCIDAGVPLPGFTDGFLGLAPDLGAYEFGGDDWVPGHDWGFPPYEEVDTRGEEEEGAPPPPAPAPMPEYFYIPDQPGHAR